MIILRSLGFLLFKEEMNTDSFGYWQAVFAIDPCAGEIIGPPDQSFRKNPPSPPNSINNTWFGETEYPCFSFLASLE